MIGAAEKRSGRRDRRALLLLCQTEGQVAPVWPCAECDSKPTQQEFFACSQFQVEVAARRPDRFCRRRMHAAPGLLWLSALCVACAFSLPACDGQACTQISADGELLVTGGEGISCM